MTRLAGQVAIVTGGGRGIGRAEALALASEGAKVVINDIGDGNPGPAESVAAEIVAGGGTAIADSSDITNWDQVEALVTRVVDEFGRIDILICNAGFLRNNPTPRMKRDDWDAVLRVHLDGSFIPAHYVSRHWEAEEASGRHSERRHIVFTTSENGLLGNPATVNYSAAKAGVAALTLCLARELVSLGVSVNAVAPRARTRLNERHKVPEGNAWAVANVGAFVALLCAQPNVSVTGQVFGVGAGAIDLYSGWHRVAHADAFGDGWTADHLRDVLPSLFAGRDSTPDEYLSTLPISVKAVSAVGTPPATESQLPGPSASPTSK